MKILQRMVMEDHNTTPRMDGSRVDWYFFLYKDEETGKGSCREFTFPHGTPYTEVIASIPTELEA